MLKVEDIEYNPVLVRGRKGGIHSMTLKEASRWMSLIECIDIIGGKVDDFANIKDSAWMKPIYFQKFIDEKYKELMYTILQHQ